MLLISSNLSNSCKYIIQCKRIKGLDLNNMQLENSQQVVLLMLHKVRLIVQGSYDRPAHHRPDLESKEEIFQHKMQAYDKVVFTPPTPRGDTSRAGETVGVTHCVRKLLFTFMGEPIYKIAETSLN